MKNGYKIFILCIFGIFILSMFIFISSNCSLEDNCFSDDLNISNYNDDSILIEDNSEILIDETGGGGFRTGGDEY